MISRWKGAHSLLVFCILCSMSYTTGNYQVCQGIQAHKDLQGNFTIGMVVPVHYRSKGKYFFNKPGLTWVHAMLFAIDEINRNRSLLPGINLGYAIYDSCNEFTLSIKSALDFLPEPSVMPGYTETFKRPLTKCQCNKTRDTVIGVVGDASSASSSRLQSVLAAKGSETAQISYSATSTELSDKVYFPSFMRTIPPDNFQALFIADILLKFNWKYVSVLASDDEYGRVGANNLLPLLQSYNICVAVQHHFEGNSNRAQMREIVKRLIAENEARVIILWCQRPDAIPFLEEAEKLGLYGRTWIATETWGNTDEVYKIDQRVVAGMFGIIPAFVEYKPFESYLASISPNATPYNPWLDEYWTRQYGCIIIQDRGLFKTYKCESQSPNIQDLPRNKYVNVIDAVYALAHSLDKLLSDRKKAGQDISTVHAHELLAYVKKVDFIGKANLAVTFDKNGDPGIASYSLMNLKVNQAGRLYFQNVGRWNQEVRNLDIVSGVGLLFSNWSSTPPKSTCSEECMSGFTALMTPSKPCCWKCIRCPDHLYKAERGQGPCKACPTNQVPNDDRNACVIPRMVFFSAVSLPGIIMLGLTTLVILLVMVIITTILWFWNTPIIKASNRELSILQLAAMLFIFLMPALYLTQPSPVTCAIRPFYFVCFYAASISVTFTKTDRLLRIFRASRSGRLTKKSRVLNNRVQFATVAALTLLGACICTIVFIIFRPSYAEMTHRFHGDVVTHYYCGGHADVLLMVLLLYIAAVSLACAIFAFKARKLPENYNEARFTSFAMFSFLMAWCCCVPLYYSMSEPNEKELVLCSLSFVATLCMLLILYVPKLYIVIAKPEENTQEKFRAKMKNASNSGGGNNPPIESSRSSHRGTITPPGSSTPNKGFEPSLDLRIFNMKINDSVVTDTDSGVYLGGFRNSRDFRT